jgi:hypothetical protein
MWLRSLGHNVGEIEPEIFHQTLCAGVFTLGKKSLVKLTSKKYGSINGLYEIDDILEKN